jgi:hypothetical protein
VTVPEGKVPQSRRRLLNWMSIGVVTPIAILTVATYFVELPKTADWGFRLHGNTATLAMLLIACALVMQGIKFYDQRDND